MKSMKFPFLSLVLLLLLSANAFAAGATTAPLTGGGEIQKPLEVKGQTRNLSMMMVSQENKSKVKFVVARRDYRQQIMNTKY